ncbi:cytoplasmic tRNA 2-thiolation protein 2 domain-containing protein [Phthorimaea operculella]|nr:cytoplasmic tRNA 2-thiolation protein 2 domain-containing protein [Phthorimaea operculella]
MDSHKKLRIAPVFLHLIGMETNSLTHAENVMKQCAKYNFDVYFVHIPHYMEEELQLSANTIPPLARDTEQQFNSLIKSLSSTTFNDFLLQIQRNLFIKCAEKLHCNFIFTGETTSTLAINLLSNLALGRGSHVEHDVGFCDARNENIKIIRPMKEISQEELNYYSKLKHLTPVKHNQLKLNSLQSVIGAFVTDLQDTFPATISTVCKTADKIGNHDETNSKGKCVICESDLGTEDTKLTALEATKFSRTVQQSDNLSFLFSFEWDTKSFNDPMNPGDSCSTAYCNACL